MKSGIGILLLMVLNLWGILMAGQTDEFPQLQFQPEQPHKFVFSNKRAAFWYGEVQQPNTGGFQGYVILEQRYIKDYTILADKKVVDRTTASDIVLRPDALVRRYADLTEIFHFVDSLNVLLLELRPDHPMELDVHFHFVEQILQQAWEWEKERKLYQTHYAGFGWDKLVYTGITAVGQVEKLEPISVDVNRVVGGFRGSAGIRMKVSGPVFVAVLFARTLPALHRLDKLLEHPEKVLTWRQERIRRLLQTNDFRTSDEQLNLAYRWALISMDELITRQRVKGIWAGLPWFNNYWGRDTFISFTGALLCTGRYREAREILLNFARFQNQDPASPQYGRIPNRVTLKEISYNTADGTPWFIKACENYVRYSGDSTFIEEIFPVVQRAMDGALRYHLDEWGFLTHGAAETWMDAVGNEGPWSPRANRAVEVEALWLEQVRISRQWARAMGFPELYRKWGFTQMKLLQNFTKRFWNSDQEFLNDHLNPDGTPNFQLRPNQVFAITVPRKPVLDEDQVQKVLSVVVNELTFPWGVASLWQHDPNFHPYHHYAPYYVPDAAYHNGVVWTWLSGPLITALAPYNPDLAYRLLQEQARQMVNMDAVGSLSELLEAWPRKGTQYPRISGTVSQAWSLAEFLRNVHQDLLGIRPDFARDTLVLAPHIPKGLNQLSARFRYGSTWLRVNYQRQADELKVSLTRQQGDAVPVLVRLQTRVDDKHWISADHSWDMKTDLTLTVRGKDAKVLANGAEVKKVHKEKRKLLTDLNFCQPTMDFQIPALRGPGFELISADHVVQRPGRTTKKLFDVDDPAGDDRGPNGKYVYPTHPAFRPGIFDGREITIWKDNDYYYFRVKYENLTNPGWHPEAGYQLTFTAITLNFGDKAGLRRTKVAMNANYTVPLEYAYNYVIYVGNGIRIANARDKTIAEYRPTDLNHPIGFPKKKEVRFSIPVKYFPDLKLRNVYVLIGGQDDHGAGGIGEFRKVGKKATEWQGGGGDREEGNPNVYDVIEVR